MRRNRLNKAYFADSSWMRRHLAHGTLRREVISKLSEKNSSFSMTSYLDWWTFVFSRNWKQDNAWTKAFGVRP